MTSIIAYSSERRGGMRTQIGSANYSYVFVEDALVQLLQQEGYRTVGVLEPETIKSPVAYKAVFDAIPSEVVHIAFRSTENIRPMHGARNICHFAWEFEVMKDGGLATDSILDNQIHMLGLMDEIWVSCRFTQVILAKYGLANTFIVPAPIIGRDLPDRIGFDDAVAALAAVGAVPLLYAGALSRDENAALVAERIGPLADHLQVGRKRAADAGRIYLTVLSPGDMRKNLLNIIDGFQLASAARPRDILIIKLAVSNRGNFRSEGIFDSLSSLCKHQMAKDDRKIVFLLDFLSNKQMEALFCVADFYISASHCEGYNLPLLQAMSYGTVPIATLNTAMLDYIDPGNAVIIAEKRMTSPIDKMAADVADRMYEISFASRFDVARALTTAAGLSEDAIRARSEAARNTVLEKYGARPVAAAIASRIDRPKARVGDLS